MKWKMIMNSRIMQALEDCICNLVIPMSATIGMLLVTIKLVMMIYK